MPFDLVSWPGFALALAGALALSLLIAVLATIPIRMIGRRRGWDDTVVRGIRRPFRVLVLVIAVTIAVQISFPLRDAVPPLAHGLRIATIASAAWLVAGLISLSFYGILARHPMDAPDNRVARRVRTQVGILWRISLVVLTIVAIGAILMTFPGVEAVGASVLASAGLASVVAGLAAQSTLANVFAGIQLAFSDAIRVDDVVIVEEQWGRIEEITLTYVVVRIWDDRRLVLPSTHFTTTPFENWTRRETELLGSVEFDLDWHVRPARMREELARIVERTELWDGRLSVLNVMDAIGDRIRVRVLVSAADSGALFDLRCLVREELVDWIQREAPSSLPIARVQLVDPAADDSREHEQHPAERRAYEGLFSGSPEAEERAQSFTSAIPIIRTEEPDEAEALRQAPADPARSR